MNNVMINPGVALVLLVFTLVIGFFIIVALHKEVNRKSITGIAVIVYIGIIGFIITGGNSYEEEKERESQEIAGKIEDKYGIRVTSDNLSERTTPRSITIIHDDNYYQGTYLFRYDPDNDDVILMIHNDPEEESAPTPAELRELKTRT